MFKLLFKNYPDEYIMRFDDAVQTANYHTVRVILYVLLPVSFFMLIMAIAISDNASIVFANGLLVAVLTILFIINLWIKRTKRPAEHLLARIVVYVAFAIILFWGLHMMGYNQNEVIFVMDMVLGIFALAFLFVTKYQVLLIYYGVSLFYLMLLTPYGVNIFSNLPKLMTPILLMFSAFIISRMLFLQFIERYVMGEKLKEKEVVLTSELIQTIEKLQITERNISNDIIRTLVKVLEHHDIYTRGHSENVSEYAVKIGEVMGLTREQLDEIMVCGLVHDIGKILIPIELLNKTATLTPEEQNVIRKHSEYGHEMLMEAKYLKRIARIVLHHHEQWDGGGYPMGLKEDEIPLESQILMVADAWDAMTSERIYKKAKTDERAKEEMLRLKGQQFPPDIVDALMQVLNT